MGDAKRLSELLRQWLLSKTSQVVLPNVYVGTSPWESDVVAVRKTRYWVEYEIKLTLADFKADFKKKSNKYSTGVLKHEVYAKSAAAFDRRHGRKRQIIKPAEFYFVTPAGLLAGVELPAHCGLIEVGDTWWRTKCIKQAPRLGKAEKLSEKAIFDLLIKASYRLTDL